MGNQVTETVNTVPDVTSQPTNTVEPKVEVASVIQPLSVPPAASGSNWLDVIIAFAWPVTIVVLALIFRRGLRRILEAVQRLVGRRIRGRYKGLEFDLEGEEPAPPAPAAPPSAAEPTLTKPGKQVLTTLWRHHHKHLGDDFKDRWSFRIPPDDDRFIPYLTGLAETVRAGLVAVSPLNLQSFLTNAGIAYCRTHVEELSRDLDLYG